MWEKKTKTTSTTRYPQCLAATCASVVFPSPGAPHSRRICIGYTQFTKTKTLILRSEKTQINFTMKRKKIIQHNVMSQWLDDNNEH